MHNPTITDVARASVRHYFFPVVWLWRLLSRKGKSIPSMKR